MLGIGLVATSLVFGTCLLLLKHDYTSLQRELAHPAASSITCPEFRHVQLRVHGRDVRCSTR